MGLIKFTDPNTAGAVGNAAAIASATTLAVMLRVNMAQIAVEMDPVGSGGRRRLFILGLDAVSTGKLGLEVDNRFGSYRLVAGTADVNFAEHYTSADTYAIDATTIGTWARIYAEATATGCLARLYKDDGTFLHEWAETHTASALGNQDWQSQAKIGRTDGQSSLTPACDVDYFAVLNSARTSDGTRSAVPVAADGDVIDVLRFAEQTGSTAAGDKGALTLTLGAHTWDGTTGAVDGSGAPPTPTVSSVTASPNPATVPVGGSGQITVTVNGTNSPAQTVTASSTNTGVATSNNAGVVSGIAAGTATIRYTSTADNTKSVDVSVTVTAVAPPPKAAIGLSTSVLAFAAAVGGAAPLPQTFTVSNTGPNGTTLNAAVAAQSTTGGSAPAWLAAVLNAGVVTVTVTPGALAVGNYTARVRVTDASASNSPQDVYVTLAVTDATPAPAPITPDYPVSGVAEVLVLKPSWPVTFTVADASKATVSPATATSGTLGVETPQPGGGTALMYRATTTVSAVAVGKLGLTATASGYEPVAIALDIRAAKTA